MYLPQIFFIVFCILFAINGIVAPSTTSLGKQRTISNSGTRHVYETPVEAVEAETSITSNSKAAADIHSSLHSISSIATEPKAGTSRIGAPERELLLEEQKRLSFLTSSINLDAALESTYGDNLDPTRDGLYGRVQRIILTHGSVAAAGAAIGYSAHEYSKIDAESAAIATTSTAITSATNEMGRSFDAVASAEFGK